jgi:hypothetical protein
VENTADIFKVEEYAKHIAIKKRSSLLVACFLPRSRKVELFLHSLVCLNGIVLH